MVIGQGGGEQRRLGRWTVAVGGGWCRQEAAVPSPKPSKNRATIEEEEAEHDGDSTGEISGGGGVFGGSARWRAVAGRRRQAAARGGRREGGRRGGGITGAEEGREQGQTLG